MRRRARKKWGTGKKFFLVLILSATLAAFLVVRAFDTRMLPAAVEIAEARTAAEIEAVIGTSIRRAVTDNGVKASDFYEITKDQNGAIAALTVNSVLINEICSSLAEDITAALSRLPEEGVEIPLGVMTGFSGLANYGPTYKVRLLPLGTASVDYLSSFTSAGINQTNFKIWVQADAELEIVNPIQAVTVRAERKILLVDAIINGAVPRANPAVEIMNP